MERQPTAPFFGQGEVFKARNFLQFAVAEVIAPPDEEFADPEKRDRLIPRKIAAIRRKLGRLMPGVATEAAFTWCASFGASTTGLPAIGPVPGAKGCYAAMGYGGNGITFSAIAAQMFQREVLGIADPDADIFGLG